MDRKVTIGALGLSTLLVTGCAMPVPIQVASWALDGISYIMTEKSVTDHGLSVVAQKDCAVWRGVTAGELCREWESDGGILVADKPVTVRRKAPAGIAASFAPSAYFDLPALENYYDDGQPRTDDGTKFRTAGASVTAAEVDTKYTQSGLVLDASTVKLPVGPDILVDVARKAPKSAVRQSVPESVTGVTSKTQPAAGTYFVIGSFRNVGNAHTMASRHGELVPSVLAARLDGAPVYRVVVGPAVPGREKSLHLRIAKMGFRDTWAIRVKPSDWSIASRINQQEARITMHSELAQSR